MESCEILILGCDDSTSFEIDLTEEEYSLLKRISRISKEVSTYGCMPTIEVTKSNKRRISYGREF